MTKPSFVYVTYIATTPEKVWQALVDTDVTRKYWSGLTTDCPVHVNVSDWRPGSRWEHRRLDDAQTVDIVGKIVESVPPRRLVLTWARPSDAEDDAKHSRVTFDIEPHGDRLVRLTVTHEDLERDPQMLAGISGGWPKVLSNLKTLLETGHALPQSGGAQPA
ncbi:SRPBCC family protein [Paraherbaspirillum soli]|uniref:SRPBCC family protein n=1 Tax=Paraherbaspirillum soli TaxID=631222 RepID=A0ABW0MBT0_9BURK